MPSKNPQTHWGDPQASRLFRSIAIELAQNRDDLDIERTVNVLARTVSDIDGRPLAKWPKAEKSSSSTVQKLPQVWFFPSIGEALQYLPPEEALTLFEKGDLELLRRRQGFTSSLGSREEPLYSIKQCASAINKLVRQLKDNRQPLIDTGYPRTAFKYSALLTRNMVELYPVRRPSEVTEEGGTYSYKWSMARWHEDGPECPYEEAPPAPGLSIADAARLESLRGRLYDARAEVLRTLVLCLRGDDPEALWRNSLAVLSKSLSEDEACFLLGIDSSRKGSEYVQPRSPLSARGALSALLGLVGHCEKELTIGTMAKAREALGELIRNDERGRPYLIFGSYYEVVGKPEQQKVEGACDMLAELKGQEKQFWGEFEEKVNSALDEEFEMEVGETKLVGPGYASQYGSFMETFGIRPLMNAEDVGKALSSPTKTVMNLARAGKLPRVMVGSKSVRFRPADVEEYIKRATVGGESGEGEEAE